MNKELLFIIKELLSKPITFVYLISSPSTHSVWALKYEYRKTLLELTQTSSTGEDIG